MNEYLKKVKNILIGEKIDARGDAEKPLTPQDFENQIFAHYKNRLDDESTFNEETNTGSMVYPVSFCIYLHPADYASLEQRFRFTVKNVVNAFCVYNRKQLVHYPDHIPHSPYWTIQFVPFAKDTIVETAGKNYNVVEAGAPLIISDLFSRKFTKDNIRQGGSVIATKRSHDLFSLKKVNLAVNEDAFRHIDNPKDKDTFVVKINPGYADLTAIPKSEDNTDVYEDQALAKLICDKEFISQSGKRGRECLMVSNQLYISGKNDERKGVQYAKVNYPLPDSIVHIKYENNDFLLAAFGKVRLNQSLLPESKGGDLEWVKLSDNSTILINGEVSIDFKIRK